MFAEKLYWHFAQCDSENIPRLGYRDGVQRDVLGQEIKAGVILRMTGEIILCQRGFHASARLIDALDYAHGPRLALCRVMLSGTIVGEGDKSAASQRTALVILDANSTRRLMRNFAKYCALQVIHLWEPPDVVRLYLETGDEVLREVVKSTTFSASWSTAQDAARDAAWSAARFSPWDAVRDAIKAAAWAAYYSASPDDDRGVTMDAALDKYTNELEQRALAAMGLEENQTPEGKA